MSLRRTVNREVKKAFKSLGDLKSQAIFTKKGNSAFDFASGEATPLVLSYFTVEGVYQSKTSKGDSKTLNKGQEARFFFPTDDFPNAEDYDEVYLENVNWKIIPPVVKDSFITTLRLQTK